MQTLLNRIEAPFTWTATGITAAVMCLSTVDALGRYLFNSPIMGAFELTSEYLLVALVFLGASYSYRTGCFVRVTIAIDRLPEPVRLAGNYIAQICSILVAGALVAASGMQAIRTLTSSTKSTGLIPYPLGPAHLIASLGLLMMTIRLLADIHRVKTGESGMLREDSEAL